MDPTIDERIRTALRDADKKGKLPVVAATVGIFDGVKRLREIMNSEGELNIVDRLMLGVHLCSSGSGK